MMLELSLKKRILIMTAVFLVALFFRFWQLNEIPPGLYPDVAINANQALDIIEKGDFRLFYVENNGREGLIMWLIALAFIFLGVSVWSVKAVAAILGALTVLGIYLFAKELLRTLRHPKADLVAIVSALFLAFSFWHTLFSRIGFRAIMVPLILCFAFYFLFKAFRSRKTSFAILAGIFLGLGNYTYISYRFAVFMLAFALALWFVIYRRQGMQRDFLKLTLACVIAGLVIFSPLAFYFLQNPQDFFGRATDVSIWQQENSLRAGGISLLAHLGMFNFYGDANWRHNYSGAPMLNWGIGIFFLWGIILSVRELFRGKLNHREILSYGLLLVWFICMLASGFLSYEGIPHALRVIGTIPVVYIFSAIGFVWTGEKVLATAKSTFHKRILFSCLVLLVGAMSYAEFYKYFSLWGYRAEVAEGYSADYVRLGEYLNTIPENIGKFVVVNRGGVLVQGVPMPAQTPLFVERTRRHTPPAKYITEENLHLILPYQQKVIVAFMAKPDQALADKMQIMFPFGAFEEQNGIWLFRLDQGVRSN